MCQASSILAIDADPVQGIGVFSFMEVVMEKAIDLIMTFFELVTGCYLEFDSGVRLVPERPERMVYSGIVTFALALLVLVAIV